MTQNEAKAIVLAKYPGASVEVLIFSYIVKFGNDYCMSKSEEQAWINAANAILNEQNESK